MSTNELRAKDAEALAVVADCVEVLGDRAKSNRALLLYEARAHLADRLDSLAGEVEEVRVDMKFVSEAYSRAEAENESLRAELARVREWIALAKATDILDPSERFGFQSAVCALTAHLDRAAAASPAPSAVEGLVQKWRDEAADHVFGGRPTVAAALQRAADELASALRSSAVVVTDAMVERACKAHWGESAWSRFTDTRRSGERLIMRTAITAALTEDRPHA